MGKQSITPTPRTTHAVLRIGLSLVLVFISFVSLSLAQAQVSALTVPLLLPSAIVYDASGNLYFAESSNHVIRKVDVSGNITTIAGTGTQGFSGDSGPSIFATLDSPQGLALDSANNLYIADTHNHRIRKLDMATGTITTIAGTTSGFSGDNGPTTAAQLNLPTALAVDSSNNLYFADTGNHRIRRIDATTDTITTIAGTGTQGFSGDNGPAINANIDSPTGLAVDSASNLYLADTHNHRIRRIDAKTSTITTIAGTGIPGFSGDNAAATSATLALPHGLTIDSTGNLYLADTANHRIRRIDATTGAITTVAGNGTQAYAGDNAAAIAASLDTPRATVISPSTLVTLTDTANQRIRQLTAAPAPATTIQTIAGLGVTTPGALTLTAPSVIAYGTGQLTATLDSATQVTGSITFFDTTPTITTTLGTVALTSNAATLSTAMLPAGPHSLTATFIGDQTHSPAQSPTLALTITPQQLTAAVTPATLLYGQTVPAITGILTGILPRDASNMSATFTTTATTLSPVGAYPIAATLSGPAVGNYAIVNPAATLTINPAPILITLSNLNATATVGSSLTIMAQVASTTSGTPTGSIVLLDGGNPLFTSALSPTGTTVFTIPSVAQGSHSFTAFYSGSANFLSGTSTPQLITVTGSTPNPDFTLASTGTTTQTIVSGSSVSYTFSVQMQPSMSSPITLAAVGLPNLATASFNPPTIPPGDTTNTFTLTIATPGATALRKSPLHNNLPPTAWALLLFPPVALTLRPRSNRIPTRLIVLATLTLALITATGCGDRVSTADTLLLSTKNYTITVTGTATTPTGSILQHSTNVTLVLEQPSN
jgi:sugar lactone lactonase YvrE